MWITRWKIVQKYHEKILYYRLKSRKRCQDAAYLFALTAYRHAGVRPCSRPMPPVVSYEIQHSLSHHRHRYFQSSLTFRGQAAAGKTGARAALYARLAGYASSCPHSIVRGEAGRPHMARPARARHFPGAALAVVHARSPESGLYTPLHQGPGCASRKVLPIAPSPVPSLGARTIYPVPDSVARTPAVDLAGSAYHHRPVHRLHHTGNHQTRTGNAD